MKGLSQYSSYPQEQWPYKSAEQTRFPVGSAFVPDDLKSTFKAINFNEMSPPRFNQPRNRAERRAFASAKRKRK